MFWTIFWVIAPVLVLVVSFLIFERGRHRLATGCKRSSSHRLFMGLTTIILFFSMIYCLVLFISGPIYYSGSRKFVKEFEAMNRVIMSYRYSGEKYEIVGAINLIVEANRELAVWKYENGFHMIDIWITDEVEALKPITAFKSEPGYVLDALERCLESGGGTR